MNIKLISLSIGLALASTHAYAGLVIEDGAARQNTIQVQGASTTPAADSQISAAQTENGFQWRRPGAAPTTSATINSHADTRNAVTQSGRRPRSVETAGWAKDLPLALALRQVIPAEFSIKENGVSLNRNVSWGGDRPWDEVLGSLANTGDFLAHIDWATKEVSLAPRLGEAARPVAQQSSAARSNNSSFSVSERAPQQTFVAAQRPIAPPAAQWSLDPALTLRENIEQWGKKAGWTIIWEGADYPIAAKASFAGDFSSPEGPVAKLIEAYESSDQPLIAKLTTMDRVLYVRNKFHENTQVVQTSPNAIGNIQ